jgi:hypothetical protein
MMPLLRISIAVTLVGCIAGCATPSSNTPSAVVTSARTKSITAERAKDAVAIGTSTRADVLASLGETLVISFDNGYEVWVYRLTGAKRGEFVILFAPSGLAAKTRLRTGA